MHTAARSDKSEQHWIKLYKKLLQTAALKKCCVEVQSRVGDQIVQETVPNGGAKEMLSRSSEQSWMKEQEKIKDDRHIMEAHSRK